MTMPPVCCERCPGKAHKLVDQFDQAGGRKPTPDRYPPRGSTAEDRAPRENVRAAWPADRFAPGGNSNALPTSSHGRTGSVGNHFGCHAGPITTVLIVKILEHLLAALVFEVDVDVGCFVPLLADEPLEEHVHLGRVDRGYSQAIAHGRIGRRAATLAKYNPVAGRNEPGPKRSGNMPRSAIARSAPAHARSMFARRGGRRGDNALWPPPKPNAKDTPSLTRPRERALRDIRNATRPAKTCSDRQPRPFAARHPARRRTDGRSPPPTSCGRWALGNMNSPDRATVRPWRTATNTSCNAAREAAW